MYAEVAVGAQRDIAINLIQDLKLHTTDLIILTLDQEPGLWISLIVLLTRYCLLHIPFIYYITVNNYNLILDVVCSHYTFKVLINTLLEYY